MKYAFLDSSVILRVILNEPHQLKEFKQVEKGFCSQIAKLECLRTLDRLHFSIRANEKEILSWREIFYEIYAKLTVIPVTAQVIDLASQPLGFSLKSLDAIHLITCQLLQRSVTQMPMFTHDTKLAAAVKSIGIKVFG